MLEFVARKLGNLNDEVIYLGGCSTALIITDPLSLDVRPTKDVDCIVDIVSLTYFSCKIIGDILLEVANKYPEIDFLVLCGHTHSESNYQALVNLMVKAGKAEYRFPQVQEIILL